MVVIYILIQDKAKGLKCSDLRVHQSSITVSKVGGGT